MLIIVLVGKLLLCYGLWAPQYAVLSRVYRSANDAANSFVLIRRTKPCFGDYVGQQRKGSRVRVLARDTREKWRITVQIARR